MSKAKRSTSPVAPPPVDPSALADPTGPPSVVSVVGHPGGLGDEGAGELPVRLAPTPLDPDRPMGAPPGPVGWFVLAQAIDAAGEPVGKAFGLAKARNLEHANIVADHAQGLAGSAFERNGAGMLLAHLRIGTFDAATMNDDELRHAEVPIKQGLSLHPRQELHGYVEGETVKAFEVKAESARSAMTHRLTAVARSLADKDDVRAGGGGGGAPVANDDKLMTVSWFKAATNSFLYSSKLRNSDRITTKGHTGRALLYRIGDVKTAWPECAKRIDDYLEQSPKRRKQNKSGTNKHI